MGFWLFVGSALCRSELIFKKGGEFLHTILICSKFMFYKKPIKLGYCAYISDKNQRILKKIEHRIHKKEVNADFKDFENFSEIDKNSYRIMCFNKCHT
ncbi:hypothetical protein [Campylobacter portucalensis]|uniref:hypothetical protein n=1 Tax=Campylobacter portucalensis TaxID=2608384 RepID=UPI001E3EAB93|nr:hypothetical protein [Campylobacter portucalensis]